jgi:hypothetical protein
MKHEIGEWVSIRLNGSDDELIQAQVIAYDPTDDSYVAAFFSRPILKSAGWRLDNDAISRRMITLAKNEELVLWVSEREIFTYHIVASHKKPRKIVQGSDFYADRLQAAAQYSRGASGETGGPSGLSFL